MCPQFRGRLILAAGDHIISYRKGSFDAWGLEAFEPGPIQINGKEYAFSPCMREVDIPVYEKKVSQKGCKINYRKTKRILNLKEVRILRADGGQTSIRGFGSSRTNVRSF